MLSFGKWNNMFHFDKLNYVENSKFEARNNASYSINYSFIDSVNFWHPLVS